METEPMPFVALRQDGNQRPGVHEHAVHFEWPKPMKYFLFVLRSFGAPLTQPIKPAAWKRSYAERLFAFFCRWRSSASRMISDSDRTCNWVQTRSRWLRLPGMRTVNRSAAIAPLTARWQLNRNGAQRQG